MLPAAEKTAAFALSTQRKPNTKNSEQNARTHTRAHTRAHTRTHTLTHAHYPCVWMNGCVRDCAGWGWLRARATGDYDRMPSVEMQTLDGVTAFVLTAQHHPRPEEVRRTGRLEGEGAAGAPRGGSFSLPELLLSCPVKSCFELWHLSCKGIARGGASLFINYNNTINYT